MSLKVIKDPLGQTISFGPNDDNYAPSIPVGCSLSIEETASLWVDPNTPILVQLQAADAPFTPRRMRESMRGTLETLAHLTALIDPEAIAAGVTQGQILAMNPTYQIVKQYDDAANAARALLL